MLREPKAKHDHQLLKFPEGFLWGAATSAHQVEGNNINSDWWDWEMKNQPPHLRSGIACDQYNRYESDFELIKHLNHNAHRLSIEWSRIEPREGEFDSLEIEHYKKVLKSLKDKDIKVMLTLWHFTLPLWLANKGGWENHKAAFYFERFVKKIAPEIHQHVDMFITLNEPEVYVYEAYITGEWPPAKKSFWAKIKVYLNLTSAHKKAYKFLHTNYPTKPVGIANNIQSYEPYHKHSLIEQLAVLFCDVGANHLFYIFTRNTHDFLGINYYFHARFKDGKGLLPVIDTTTNQSSNASDLGWEIYPEGLYDVLADMSDHLPIYITECGIASTNDDRRNRFLINYLHEVYKAISTGIDVRGFFYWSLIDNFEWHRGFNPRFGLVGIDYTTQERHLRPSALVYTDIIQHNGIPHSLLRFTGHTIQASEVLAKRLREELNPKP